jgi:methionyl-tRNA formyltransferase
LIRALDFGRYLNPMATPQVLRGNEALIVTRAEPREAAARAAPGTVVALDEQGIEVAAGDGVVRLLGFTTQTGHEVTPAQAARHLGLALGERLSDLAPADREQLR